MAMPVCQSSQTVLNLTPIPYERDLDAPFTQRSFKALFGHASVVGVASLLVSNMDYELDGEAYTSV